jgi:hypothetical protein
VWSIQYEDNELVSASRGTHENLPFERLLRPGLDKGVLAAALIPNLYACRHDREGVGLESRQEQDDLARCVSAPM